MPLLADSNSSLSTVCALARSAWGAAAVSIAAVETDMLHYVAADGLGAELIVGTRLPAGRGIAGFVAATGQSLTVSDPVNDPRFAHEIGERTGFVPTTIQCVAVESDAGDVVAVVSILDRGASVGRADDVQIERVTALVAVLVEATATPEPGGDAMRVAQRLSRLSRRDRTVAECAIDALLAALER